MTSRTSPRNFRLASLFAVAALAASALLLGGCGKSDKEKAGAKPAAAAGGAAAVKGLESVEQRVSYGVGYNMGSNLAGQSDFAVDQAALKSGLDDGLAKAKTRLSEADLQAAFAAVQQKATAAAAVAGEKNQAIAAAFLEKNKARAGVKVTASGLQYEVLTRGKGAKPKATDTVEVHYHGTLVDGTVFDSSVERGQTATFQVGGVIRGWVEALPMMAVGDKWKLYIPPALGYGPRGSGKIPPNSALIFEVQLIAIK